MSKRSNKAGSKRVPLKEGETSDEEKYSNESNLSSDDDDDDDDYNDDDQETIHDLKSPYAPTTTFILGNMDLPSPPLKSPFEIDVMDGQPKGSQHSTLPLPSGSTLPKWSPILEPLYIVLLLVLFWGALWGILGNSALPGSNVFSLLILLLFCHICGRLMKLISLPPLFGMLIMGCILRNVPYVNFAKDIDKLWASTLRQVALVIILTRAGLGLDYKALKQLSFICLRLALIPCMIEVISVAIIAHFLNGFPWNWSLLLGFVLAAVSPAVVVPSMLYLQKKGLGTNKGIPTLVIAASSIDDVLAITGFSIMLSIIFSNGSIPWISVKGFLEVIVGLLYGVYLGSAFWFVPETKHDFKLMTFLLICGGLFSNFVAPMLDFGGAGPLGALTLAFVAAIRWRTQNRLNKVQKIYSTLWVFAEPLLFGLIGTEIDFAEIHPSHLGKGIATIIMCIILRLMATSLIVFGGNFSWKEKLFLCFAWSPKATVQAAIGPVALDNVRKMGLGDEQMEDYGLEVLTMAVLSIAITAPLGALSIALSAPKLLTQEPTESPSTVTKKL